jgi:hypothetical protein
MLKTAVLILSVLVTRNFGCSRTAGILICSSLCDPDALGHQEVTVSGEDIVGGCAGPELQVTLTFLSWCIGFIGFSVKRSVPDFLLNRTMLSSRC